MAAEASRHTGCLAVTNTSAPVAGTVAIADDSKPVGEDLNLTKPSNLNLMNLKPVGTFTRTRASGGPIEAAQITFRFTFRPM